MYFNEAEVVELGLAEELILDEPDQDTTEELTNRIKQFSAIYVADAE